MSQIAQGAIDQRQSQAAQGAIGQHPSLHSALYVGHIRHRRYFPHANAFSYPIYLMYLDLDELEQVFAGRWLYGLESTNVVSFRRKDFFGDASKPLKQEIWRAVQEKTGECPNGPVRLLTHLRHFGLSFNPVSFYYCYFPDGVTLHSIVAEITNTPWRERHAYVLCVSDAERHGNALLPTLHWRFDKAFHVSPFLRMHMHYSWRFQIPTQDLRVHMNVYESTRGAVDVSTSTATFIPGALQFDSTLVLQKRAITGRSMAYALWRFPWITLSVVWKIYWQALKIKWKKNPFFDHPAESSPPSNTK
jgi:uncharacterized protein